MEKIQLLKKEVLTRTLSLVDEPYEKWRTFNKKMNTILFLENEQIKNKSIKLKNSELPLLECKLNDSYVLISTDKVYSILSSKSNEILIENISRFGNEFEKENVEPVGGLQPQTNKVVLYGDEGEKLIFQIDSLYPAYFAKILIHNLISYKRKGVFSWK